MCEFLKVKYVDCRYTPSGGSDMWLNLDNVVAFEEEARLVHTTSGQVFPVSVDAASKLIEVLKGGVKDNG